MEHLCGCSLDDFLGGREEDGNWMYCAGCNSPAVQPEVNLIVPQTFRTANRDGVTVRQQVKEMHENAARNGVELQKAR